MKIYIDGQFYDKDNAKVSVFDHGLLYGDGIFEGIRAYNGRVFELGEHLDRLYDSAKAILLDIPIPREQMAQVIVESVRVNRLKDAYIRVVVTRGVGDLGLDMRKCKVPTIVVIVDKIALYPKEVYEKGLELAVASLRRLSPDQLSPSIKSLNYLNNILARAEATRSGCEEAILLNAQGYVAECSGDNLFYVRQGRLITPPVWAGILEGVTRNVVMKLAREMGLEVSEEIFTVDELYRADEVFVTGTGAEILGVIRISGRTINEGRPGPVTKQMITAFRQYANSTGTPVYEEAKVSG